MGGGPPAVAFTDAKTDVLRRDFTINGLLYDPIEQRVIDYVSGQADIRDRIVRAIGDPQKRFAGRQASAAARHSVWCPPWLFDRA